jgi:hypothetical protein
MLENQFIIFSTQICIKLIFVHFRARIVIHIRECRLKIGVVSSKPLPIYTREKSPWNPLDKGLGGLHSRSGL